MPGALHCEAPNGAAPLSAVSAGFFQIPTSPDTSGSIYLAKSTTSSYSDAPSPMPIAKRKRYGLDESLPANAHTLTGATENTSRPSLSGRGSSSRGVPNTGFGRIATSNGIDRKPLGYMEDSMYSEVDYRRALGSRRLHEGTDLSSTVNMAPVDPQEGPQGVGWSRLALNTIGGVVGKVWEFCREGAFRGFYAGGGQGYDVQQPAALNGNIWCNEHDIPTLPIYGSKPIPGGFPESDYASFHYEREDLRSTPPPAAKRRQISDAHARDDLGKNWVMVHDHIEQRSRPVVQIPTPSTDSTPKSQPRPTLNRRISKPVSRLNTPVLARGPSNNVSHAGSVTLSNREPASFASPRSPIIHGSPSTPSRIPLPSRARSPSVHSPKRLHQPSRIPSPGPYSPRGHRRAHSTASVSSASGNSGRQKQRTSIAQGSVDENSPRLDPKAKNMIMQRMKQERETDARINDFNSRLMDMIRQGKEALGTTVEIDGDVNIDDIDPWEDD